MMRVYIVYDTQRYNLPSVYLKDGFYPEYVGSKGDGLPPMEPAIWGKILILDSVLISYDNKCITWSIIRDESDSNQEHIHWSCEDCSGHDDEEEVYEMVKFIIDKSFEDCKLLLFRILHCYVLPKISFDLNDLEKVELARKDQVKNLQTLTDKLEAKCFDVSDCQDKLDSIQEEFLPCTDKMINNGQCSKQFLELLLCDLVDHERRVREKTAITQSRYTELIPTQPSSLKRSSLELLEARQERDFMDKKLVLILTAREEILDRKENLPAVSEGHVNSILQDYMDKRSLLQTLKEEKNKLTQQQHCALMVRETLDSILTDLKDNGFAQAFNADARGVRPTDVLQNGLQPEWQTTSERVATIVYNPKHPIGTLFERFCSEIHDICQDPYKLQNGKTEILQFSRSSFYVSMQPTEILSDNEYVSVELKTVDPYKDKLFEIKEKISLHMEKATKLLSKHFNKTESCFQNKLRLAYEHCFYEKTYQEVSWLYNQVYYQHVDDIQKDVQRITERFGANLLSLPVNRIFQDIFKQQEPQMNSALSSSERNGLSHSVLHTDDQHNFSDDMQRTDCHLSLPEDDLSSSSFQMDNSYNCFLDDTANIDPHEPLQVHAMKARYYLINVMKDCCKATTLKPCNFGSLGSLIDEWDTKAKPIAESLERSLSIEKEDENQNKRHFYCRKGYDDTTFEEYFQPALKHIKAVLKAVSPLQKIKHLHISLQIILSKASEFQEGNKNSVSHDKCLPLLGLLLLQLQSSQVASLWIQLVMLEDLTAPFLCRGPFSHTVTNYQKILRVIEDLWLELSKGNTQCSVNGVVALKPI